jgi:hypothetical protein
MAQPALDFFTRRAFTCKIEVTEGTDSTPSNSTDGILLLNGSTSTAFDKVERQIDRPFFTNDPFVVANTRGIIEGDFEIFCPATPGQATTGVYVQEVLLTTAGMTAVKSASSPKSTTYNPITSSIPSATMYGWIVDKKRALTGGRGNVTGLTMKIGDRFKGHLQFQGSYTFSEVTLPTVTTYGTTPAVSTAANSTSKISCADASISNLALWSKQLSIDFGNQLSTSEYTAKKVNRISDRKGTFTLICARTALADFNPWAVRDAGSIITAGYTLNETSVLSTTLNIRGQIENITEQALDNGDSGWQITGPLVASSAGGDEFSIVFLDSTP